MTEYVADATCPPWCEVHDPAGSYVIHTGRVANIEPTFDDNSDCLAVRVDLRQWPHEPGYDDERLAVLSIGSADDIEFLKQVDGRLAPDPDPARRRHLEVCLTADDVRQVGRALLQAAELLEQA